MRKSRGAGEEISLSRFQRGTATLWGEYLAMFLRSPLLRTLLAITPGLFLAAPSRAASLQPVDNWGADGVPSTVSMSIYVPDNLAENPPILVLAHYCGGTASAVFGQAQGGGLVAAADQYGFIMVVPEAANPDGSGRCWDVGSDAALTRDGGGDTEAIAQMVRYTLNEYAANPDRIYITGDSSGGMTTQAMLALYPDLFKGGSAMAGVPAGCWAESNPDGSWSGPCAGGSVTHSPEQWGQIVQDMYPGYTGHRPRVQLFHGDADDIIRYANHTEAIKQWTQVLGLSETPTTTSTVQLGNHEATRRQWEDECGYVVLDAFQSIGGDHGPSDALFLADFVVPFLGLDQKDPTDPEIAECGGTTGSGEAGAGGSAGAPGSLGGPAGAGATDVGGAVGSGATAGAPPTTAGGATGTAAAGGTASGTQPAATGGTPSGTQPAATGGTPSGTQPVATGGTPSGTQPAATGGTGPTTTPDPIPAGGTTTGVVSTPGGGTDTPTTGGGAAATTATGGMSSQPTPGAAASAGTGTATESSSDDGCGCRVMSHRSRPAFVAGLGILAALALGRRRRRA